MQYLTRPRRDSLADNLLGSFCCLVIALLIYIPNSGYPASCATRAGITVYLWFCAMPAMIIFMLLLLAFLIPVLRLITGWLKVDNRMGILNVTLVSAIVMAFPLVFVAPEAIVQACIAGAVAGLVFTIARDFAGLLVGLER